MVADIGAFATANPPASDFLVPTGVQFAFEPYRDGFLVSDGHHNRLHQVRHDGAVSVRLALPNVVPTGLALKGSTVFVAESGPLPHLPQDGKVGAFGPRASSATTVAAGGPLMVESSGPAGTGCTRSRRATGRSAARRAPPRRPARAGCTPSATTARCGSSRTVSTSRRRSRSCTARPGS
ncbi:hypothetical protein ACFO3K_05625 [Cellulomonas algicola]|uniref:hypothetical protein n=1 Tax=Cellulomonas algicola TaxID=2071633 RepID=UPI001C3F7C8F|nr:hypothetical protein [Cellulomonas algicola]